MHRTHDRARRLRAAALAVALLVASLLAGGPSPEASSAVGQAEGIDVSHWQGSIDWAKVAGAGKRFAFLKATQGTGYADPTYATNRSRANAVGIPTGAYHFADVTQTPSNAGGARAEADWFVQTAQLRAGDLPPVFDIEKNEGLGQVALTDWAMTWLERVRQQTGIYPMVYTSPNGWSTRFGTSGNVVAESGYGLLWVAHWTTASSPTVPANNWAGNGWTFWQYTSDGTVPGISGRVDLDRYEAADVTPLLLRSLTITKAGVGGSFGGVRQDGLGGFCAGTCDATTRLSVGGARTTLAPQSSDPDTTWTWGGDCAGAPVGGTCTLDMTVDRAVTITYAPAVSITVLAAGTGNGAVASTPAAISCTATGGAASGTCTAGFPSGTEVALQATPAAGSLFTGWSGACTGTGSCVVAPEGLTTVTATFGPAPVTLTMAVAGSGSGTVTATGPVTCPSTCTATYPIGTPATVGRTEAPGSRFVGWTGACTGTGTCTPAMTSDRSVTATFALVVPRTLTPSLATITVRKGQTASFAGLLTTGDARCSVAGQTVALWAASGTSALTSTRTATGGGYTLSRKMGGVGTFTFVVKAPEVLPSVSGNPICGATTSSSIVVTVTP